VPGVEIEGFRIVVNTRDERGHKPHVHVIKGRTRCKIVLDSSLTPYDIVRMPQRDVRRARELVGDNFGFFADLWEEYNA
jgi:uncharacterized protein DUF4160